MVDGALLSRSRRQARNLFDRGMSDDARANRSQGRVSWPAVRPNGDIACIINARLTLPCGDAAAEARSRSRRVWSDRLLAGWQHGLFLVAERSRHGGIVVGRSRHSPRTAVVELQPRCIRAFGVGRWHGRVQGADRIARTLPTSRFEGGPTRQLTTFQSETPSYHPTRPLIAFTYGTWRRVIDDAKYPDIAQEIGVVDVSQSLPAAKPSEVLEDSDSEDQAMTWSPNGKWIAFHTHKEMSDDVWLRPPRRGYGGSNADKRITFLGRGAEVGWPRWSPDGRTVLLNGARKSDGASVLYTDRRQPGHGRDHIGAARDCGQRHHRRDGACRMAAGQQHRDRRSRRKVRAVT